MPRSLCLIGNSHLVALQAAAAQAPGGPDGLRLTWHGFRGNTLREVAIRDRRLVPMTDDARDQMIRYSGAEEADLAQHDVFAVVGLNVKLLHALSIWKEARWPGLPSLDSAADLAAMRPRLISRGAARAGLAALLGALTGADTAARLAQATGRPVLIVPPPALHERALRSDFGQFFGIGRAVATGDAGQIAGLFHEAVGLMAARIGARFVPQPALTLRRHLLTRAAFMAGQAGGHAGNPVRADDTHANAAYGQLMLRAILDEAAR